MPNRERLRRLEKASAGCEKSLSGVRITYIGKTCAIYGQLERATGAPIWRGLFQREAGHFRLACVRDVLFIFVHVV